MENRTISFEDLPQATSALQGEVQALRSVVEQLVVEIKSSNGKETVEEMIGIDRSSCSNALNFTSGWRARASAKKRLPM